MTSAGLNGPDPVTTEVISSSLLAAAEEMGEVLVRSSFSANIKERRDCSTAILGPTGDTIAQASHIPLHMGSMLGLVQTLLDRVPASEIRPGDVFIANDPYSGGGSHLPDVTLAAPFFVEGRLVALVANVAHHAELGGSPSNTADIYSEGLRIPLVRLYEAGEVRQDVLGLILLNTRLPAERRADLRAQVASLNAGLARAEEITKRYGLAAVSASIEHMQDQAEAQCRAAIASIPDGTYRFTDHMDDDGFDSGPLPITVKLTVSGDRIACDFGGSAPQVKGPINLPYYATLACVYYAIKAAVDPTLPANSGFYRAIEVTAPESTIVNCTEPSPTIFRSDTAQRVVEAVLGALAQADQSRVTAASNGAVSGVYFLGRKQDGGYYAYVETIGGGMGAGIEGDGPDGIQVHTTNTSNLPVEALESEYPVLVERYELVPDSGGAGTHRGGLGLRRTYCVLSDDTAVRTKGERSTIPPWGLAGGAAGGTSRVVLDPGGPEETRLGAKQYDLRLNAGDRLEIVTPGAGGYGPPAEREPEALRRDLRDGKLTPGAARETYGHDE